MKNMKDKMVGLTSQLVKFKSYESEGREKRAVFNFVYDWLEKREIDLEKFEHDDHPSLLVNIPGKGEKTVLLMAHLDVVSAGEEMFKVKLEDDIMRGRGVLDNKGVVAMLMLLADRLKETEINSNVKILFTTDEEIGGKNGAGRVSSFKHFKNLDFIIALDGGLQNKIIYKEKGILQLELVVKGKSGHGAKPWLAKNPINKAFEIYQQIEKLLIETEFDKDWCSTVSLTRLVSGHEINQIPEMAEMSLDIRYTEKYSADELFEKIKLFFDNSIEIKKAHIHNVLHSDKDHKYIRFYQQIMETELREKISIEGEHSGSDVAYFMSLGVPVILHRANGGDVHSENEWVSISSLEKMMMGLEKFLKVFN